MHRLLLAFPFALLVTFILFSAMALMVDNRESAGQPESETLSFDILVSEPEPEVNRRQRIRPVLPPPPDPVPPQKRVLSRMDQNTAVQKKLVQKAYEQGTVLPSVKSLLNLNADIGGVAVIAPDIGDFGVNQQAVPIYRTEPRYPDKALKRRIEGYVVMSFTIDTSGRVKDIRVTEANPKRIFDKEAISALKKWKYQALIINGKSVSQPDQKVRLEFKLGK